LLERSFLDAFLDSLKQANFLNGSVVFLVLVIVCLLAFKLRFPIPKKLYFSAIAWAVLIPFFIPSSISRIVALVAAGIIMIGDVILYTRLSEKLPTSHENILDRLQGFAIVLFLWMSLSLLVSSVNLAGTLASSPSNTSAKLTNKLNYPEKERILLIFSVPENYSQSGFMDVWLPVSDGQNFSESSCYQLEYFKSPFLKVEGRSDVYVTGIQYLDCGKTIYW
jgi:hypothetical protein